MSFQLVEPLVCSTCTEAWSGNVHQCPPHADLWLEQEGDACARRITWAEFVRDNKDEFQMLVEVRAALDSGNYYEGGGGAFVGFVVREVV